MKILNVNVDDDLHRKLKSHAAQSGLTIRQYVRNAIIEKIKREIDEHDPYTDRPPYDDKSSARVFAR